nr:glutathione S-transferase family protein [Halomonas socia]
MHLYMSTNSPYVRKVRCLLSEAGLRDRVTETAINPRDPTTGFWELAPAGRIPALELADGTVLTESDIIAAYLDKTFVQSRLVAPVLADPVRSRILALANGMLDTGMIARVEKQRTGAADSEAFVAKHLDAVQRLAARLEVLVNDPDDTVDYADIAVVSAVDWIAFRHPDIFLAENHARLARFTEALNCRPAFATTRPST